MSADVVAPASSPTKEQPEAETKMDTSAADPEPMQIEGAPVNGGEEPAVEATTSKRKRSSKKPVETDESSVSNTRPRRTMTKREEAPPPATNGTGKAGKVKAQRTSAEQAAADADDEQERDKNIPVIHDVADVVWVKMGGHPWWPSLIIRDPNDATRCFTKITGNARAKRMYFVAFYGSTADFAWVPDSSVIPYQGVEAFTKYAQDTVDKAVTKSQKEQLTERFQLKVTISRREDWEMAVREADQAVKQTSETRLEEIDPKIQFYRSKFTSAKGQGGRKSKAAAAKADDSSEPPSVPPSSVDASDRSTTAEKAFDYNSDAESSAEETPARKSSSTRTKLKKQASNDSNNTPPAKRRQARKSTTADEHKTNGSGIRSNDASQQDEEGSSKKRARARISKPSVITNNGQKPRAESPSAAAKTPTQRKSATKPPPVSSLSNILVGQHHRFESRIGFLSPFEEQEVFDVVEQLRSTKTFDEAEQIARHRFEQILCLNLNKTTVDIPQDWFYSFLFAHPILIVKNPQWFNDAKKSVALDNSAILNQSSTSSQVLKHQLSILSKLYRNELQVRPAGGE